MELTFLKKEKQYIEIKFNEMDIGLLNALKEIILKDADIEFAAVKKGHFLDDKHILSIRTKKKDAISVIKKAIDEFQKDLDKLEVQLKK